MSFCEVKEFENGIKVRLDFIDPDMELALWLPEWMKWRWAGKFDPNTGIHFIKREYSKHFHHILQSFGISAYILKVLEVRGLKLISMDILDTKETFEITYEKLKLEAAWKNWSDLGFDRQAFAPITLWEKKH